MTTNAPEKGDSRANNAADTGRNGTEERPRRARRTDGRPGENGTGGTASRRTGTETGGTASRRRTGTRSLNARRAAQLAAREVAELTGRQPENVISVAKDEDGWQVGIEVVELHRIPDTADILAVYQVRLDARGELVSCSREHRYHRASTEDG